MSVDKLTVKTINEDGTIEDKDIFMSFALLNALVRVIGDPSRAATMDMDAELAQLVLTLVLVPRSPTGKPTVSFDDFDLPGLDPDEAFKVLDWVRENILNFFVSRLRTSLEVLEVRKDDLKSLGSLKAGLEVSASNS